MILVSLRLRVAADRHADVLQALRGQVGPIRVEEGCASCTLAHDLLGEDMFLFVEEWETRADLDRHLRTEGFKVILAALDLVELQDLANALAAFSLPFDPDRGGASLPDAREVLAPRIDQLIEALSR